jgi:predicted kinase
MRGYPGSGKSTIARTIPGVRVSRDDLRLQMYGKYQVGAAGEEAVTVAERALVRSLLNAGLDVIVDAMHVNPRYLRFWAKLADELGVEFEVHDVRTPIRECIARDITRGGEKLVGQSVIEKQARKFPMEKWPTITKPPSIVIDPYVHNTSLSPAIIVDIDGTLAHMTGRSPYDYTQVHTDEPDPYVADLVYDIYEYRNLGCCYPMDNHMRVLIVSGRDDDCRKDTEQWLSDNLIKYDALYMRPMDALDNHGNKLPDWIVKLDIFNKHIRHQYNVQFVLDDRNQVVRMWRKLGLKCLQVQEGDF